MAVTVAQLKTRIDNELSLLGSIEDATKSELIKDALAEFCRLFEPEISASLAIVANTTTYSIPDTIEKIVGILDTNSVDVVYSLNKLQRKITLQGTPSTGTTYTIFGTPRSVRTNYTTIIQGTGETYVGALAENYIDVLWAFIIAAVHGHAESDKASEKMTIARAKVREMRKDRNRNPDAYSQVLQMRDVRGNLIDDISNADNIDPDITDLFESDL